MGVDDSEGQPSSVERVRCLNCNASYVKPAGGGIVSANPGCPRCGYVGWVLEKGAINGDAAPSRSVSGRLRRHTG
jgi:hypothetical protein